MKPPAALHLHWPRSSDGPPQRRPLRQSMLAVSLWLVGTSAQAQVTVAPVNQAGGSDRLSSDFAAPLEDARSQLSDVLMLRDTADNGPANSGAVSFVESATAVREWFLAFGTMSSTNGYQFPLTLTVNPFHFWRELRLANGDSLSALTNGFERRLDQSEIAVTYAPLVVQPKANHTPGLVGSNSQKATFSFKMALLGTLTPDDLNTDFDRAAKDAFDQLASEIPQLSEAQIRSRHDAIANQYIPALEGNIARQTSIFMKGAYTENSQSGKPDSALAIITIGKELGNKDTPRSKNPIALTGTLTHTWFTALQIAPQYTEDSIAAGASAGITDTISISLQAGFDRYSGTGFSGIPGVVDPTRRTDLNLVQSLKLLIPRKDTAKDKLEIGLKEQHLGSGNTDVALTLTYTRSPRPKHPPASG